MSPRSLFILGLAIPLLAGGNFFVFLTPPIGVLCFDLVVIASFASAAKQETTDGGLPATRMTRLALLSVLLLGLWWGATLAFRPSGPRAALEAQGLFCGILLFAVLSRKALPRPEVRNIVRGLIIGTLLTALYAQYQYWIAFPRSAPVLASAGIPVIELINANFYNANCYGAFVSAVILLAAGFAMAEGATRSGRLAACATLLLLGTLLLSESRSAIALFTLATIAWLAPPRRTWGSKRKLLTLVLPLGLFLFAGAAATVDMHELWGVGLLGRIAIWHGSLAMIYDHWLFGVGLGRFWDYFTQYRVNTYYTRYPHNFLLEVFAELGIIGGVSLLGFLVAAAVAPVRTFVLIRSSPERLAKQRALLAPILGSGVLILHGLLDIDWHAPANVILLFVLLGMTQNLSDDTAAATADVKAS